MTETCYICGASAELVSETRPFRIGSREANVLQNFMRCSECGEEFLRPEQATENQRRAAQAIRVEEGLLAPERIRAIRERLSLSQEGLERLLGVGAKTAVRWERGTVFQSKAADSLLRLVEASPEARRLLARWSGVQLAREPGAPHEARAQSPAFNLAVVSSHLDTVNRAADLLSEFEAWQTKGGGASFVIYYRLGGEPLDKEAEFPDWRTRGRYVHNRIPEGLGVG